MEIHKNIAATQFYKEVVNGDPILEEDIDQEQYEQFFEENYNDIGNNLINYVQYLAANLEEQLQSAEEKDEKIEELGERLEQLEKELGETKAFCEELQKGHLSGDDADSQEVRKLKKRIQLVQNKADQ